MSQTKEHVLGTGNIASLLWQYSLPAIAAMVIVSLYNIVDSIFIGHGVGVLGITALAIAFPFMNLVFALCFLVGAGGAAISSIYMGKKDMDTTNKVLGQVMVLSTINGVIFGIASQFVLEPALRLFGASPETIPYAYDFMQIILFTLPIAYIMIGLNSILRATGFPRKAMWSSLLSVAVNIALAPIFIFVLGWGMRGAAIATAISQLCSMIWVVAHFMDKSNPVHFQPGIWKLDLKLTKEIYAIGMSPFLMNVCACLVVVIINNSLLQHGGDMAIGAYGILNRVLMLIVMVIMGLTQGMQPIVGYNYGARQFGRVRQALIYSIVAGMGVSTLGFFAAELFPHALSAMFTNNVEMIDLSTTAMRLASIAMPVVGCQIVITNFFQSIGKAKISIFLSLSRQLGFLVPCLMIFPNLWGVNGVWLSMPVSDFLSWITAVLMLLWLFKKMKKEDTPSLA